MHPISAKRQPHTVRQELAGTSRPATATTWTRPSFQEDPTKSPGAQPPGALPAPRGASQAPRRPPLRHEMWKGKAPQLEHSPPGRRSPGTAVARHHLQVAARAAGRSQPKRVATTAAPAGPLPESSSHGLSLSAPRSSTSSCSSPSPSHSELTPPSSQSAQAADSSASAGRCRASATAWAPSRYGRLTLRRN